MYTNEGKLWKCSQPTNRDPYALAGVVCRSGLRRFELWLNHYCQLCAEEALMPPTPHLIFSSSKFELLASQSAVLPVQGGHLWVVQAMTPLPGPKCGSGGIFSGWLLPQCPLLPNLPVWPGLPHLFPCTLPFINSELFRVPWRQRWWFTHLHGLFLSCWDKARHLFTPSLFFSMSFIVHLLCAWLWDAVIR